VVEKCGFWKPIIKKFDDLKLYFRMVDVGSEWRTFSNDKDSKDMSRVGAVENPLLDGDNLETVMSTGTGAGALDEFGKQKYNNGPRQVPSIFNLSKEKYVFFLLDVICG
jgi:transcription initiation factor TFIIIB Brf1 subunit/transcription initiation factor TFIIB